MSTNIEDEEELANWLGGYEEPMKMGGSSSSRVSKSKKRLKRGGSSRTVNDLSDEIFIKTVQVLKDMGANGSSELDDHSSRSDILHVLKNQMKLQTFMEWAIPRYTAFLDDIRKRAGAERKQATPSQIKDMNTMLFDERQPFLFQHMWCMHLVLVVFEQHDWVQMDEHFKVLTQSIHETSSRFCDIHPVFAYVLSQSTRSYIFRDFLSWCPIAWPCKQPGVMQTTYLKYMFYNLDENGNPPSAVFHILPIFAEKITFGPHGHNLYYKFHVDHDIAHFISMRRVVELENPTGESTLSWNMLRQHLNFILAPNTDPMHKAVQLFCSILLFRAFHEDYRVYAYWEEYFNDRATLLNADEGHIEMIYTTASVMPLIQFAAKTCDKTFLKLLKPYTAANHDYQKQMDNSQAHHEHVKQGEERLLSKMFPNGKRMQLSEVHVHKFKPVMECILHHHPEILNDNQFLWNAQNKLSLLPNNNLLSSSSSSLSLSSPRTTSRRKTKRSLVYPTIFTKRRRSTTKRHGK